MVVCNFDISRDRTSNFKCLQTLEGYSGWIDSVVFSHDSKLLALTSSGNTIKIWDASDGKCLQTLEGHIDGVNSVVFSHDSKHLASASFDKTIKIWDADNGRCLQTFQVYRIPTNISFDSTNLFLQTDIGALNLESRSASMSTQSTADSKELCRRGYGVSSDGRWIARDSENFLRLPPEYRPLGLVVAASTVAISCRSGRVLIFRFDDSIQVF